MHDYGRIEEVPLNRLQFRRRHEQIQIANGISPSTKASGNFGSLDVWAATHVRDKAGRNLTRLAV
jgi:hypothetical protein